MLLGCVCNSKERQGEQERVRDSLTHWLRQAFFAKITSNHWLFPFQEGEKMRRLSTSWMAVAATKLALLCYFNWSSSSNLGYVADYNWATEAQANQKLCQQLDCEANGESVRIISQLNLADVIRYSFLEFVSWLAGNIIHGVIRYNSPLHTKINRVSEPSCSLYRPCHFARKFIEQIMPENVCMKKLRWALIGEWYLFSSRLTWQPFFINFLIWLRAYVLEAIVGNRAMERVQDIQGLILHRESRMEKKKETSRLLFGLTVVRRRKNLPSRNFFLIPNSGSWQSLLPRQLLQKSPFKLTAIISHTRGGRKKKNITLACAHAQERKKRSHSDGNTVFV